MVKRSKPIKSGDVSRNKLRTENQFTVPLGISFGNHGTYNKEDHAFEVIPTSGDYDALIPVWYFEKPQARGATTSHLHFPHCPAECYNHQKIHPEYSITYDQRIAFNEKAVNIGVIVMSNPMLAQKLPTHYHKFYSYSAPRKRRNCQIILDVIIE
jgi:hypothetical protein